MHNDIQKDTLLFVTWIMPSDFNCIHSQYCKASTTYYTQIIRIEGENNVLVPQILEVQSCRLIPFQNNYTISISLTPPEPAAWDISGEVFSILMGHNKLYHLFTLSIVLWGLTVIAADHSEAANSDTWETCHGQTQGRQVFTR